MSTPAIAPVATPAAPPTEVSIANTPAEILASHAAEKAAPPIVEAPVTSVATAPVVETPKPYTVTKNANGSVNVEFANGGEKFTGTQDEVFEKVLASKAEGNNYIKELKTKAEVPIPATESPVAPVTPNRWSPDEATSVSALNGALTGGNFGDFVGIGMTQFFGGNDPAQIRQAIGDILQLSAELKGQKEISKFAQAAPDFLWAEANTQLLIKEAQSRNLPLTAENLVFTHQALKGMGKYQAAATNVATQQTPNPAPLSQSGNVQVTTDIDPWTVPLDQLAANIRAGK